MFVAVAVVLVACTECSDKHASRLAVFAVAFESCD